MLKFAVVRDVTNYRLGAHKTKNNVAKDRPSRSHSAAAVAGFEGSKGRIRCTLTGDNFIILYSDTVMAGGCNFSTTVKVKQR